MRLFDFNYHIPKVKPDVDLQAPSNQAILQSAISQEYRLTDHDWRSLLLDAIQQSNQRCTEGAHIMILSQDFAKDNTCLEWLQQSSVVAVSALMDFRDPNIESIIDNWSQIGGRGIKLHPYLQCITEKDYPKVVRCARFAADRGLWISVDCSFGTMDLYRCSGPKLLSHVLPKIKDVPVVALHFGGPRILEVMMLAMAAPNLYLDCSLSLSYWKGSTVEEDLAFAIRKLGPSRFMFGSDQPFVSFNKACSDMEDFLDKHGFTEDQSSWIWYRSAQSLLRRQ